MRRIACARGRRVSWGVAGLFVAVSAGCTCPCGPLKDGMGAGWTALYNGRDLTGWEEVKTKNTWHAEGERLVCTGGGGGWLSTADEYADFELELDFNVPPGGNSGVFMRTPRTGDPAHEALEIQILDDDADIHKDIKVWQHTGSIYAVVPPSKPMQKKAGEWNHYRIVCRGPQVAVWLNGEKVSEADMDREEKLRSRPRRGYIGLQNHGSGVAYKNIKIRKL